MGHGKFEKPRTPRETSGEQTVKRKTAAQREEATGKSKTNKILLRIMIVVLSILLVLLLVVAFVMNYVLGKIGRYDPDADYTGSGVEEFETDPTVEGQETVDPDDVVWDEVDEMAAEEHIINILLIGNDARPGETRARSDTMILVSLNKQTNDVQLTSFMRDLYVQIPGYQDNRINASYALGGPELLDDTLKTNFGVQVDGNVSVNFEAFTEIIDILGGVEIELDSEEAKYMNTYADGTYSAGKIHLDGESALVYARMRHVSGGDYTRTERQRNVITAVMQSLKSASIGDVINLINKVLPYVTTDLTDGEIIEYATLGLNALASGGDMSSIRIPQDDAHYAATIREMSVLVPDLKMCQEDLREFIYNNEG